MAIITISRGSFSHGKEIAECVARKLGYSCISREILLEASRFFDVPEVKLARIIRDAPSLLERITHGREKYLNYIRAALLEHAREDNIVYHGHAGHLLLPSICHIFKVRVIADFSERVDYLCRSESKTEEEARHFLIHADKERAHWTQYLYGVDLNDPALYDLVIHINKLKVEQACDIIVQQAQSGIYDSSAESIRMVNDLAISSLIQAALQEICQAEVSSRNGLVTVRVTPPRIRKSSYASHDTEKRIEMDIQENLTREIMKIAEKIDGVTDVICHVEPPAYH